MLTSNGYRLDESPARLGALVPTPAAETTDRNALWARLRRQGYLFLPGHLPVADVLDFRRYYFASMQPTGLLAAGAGAERGIAGPGPVDLAAVRRTLFGAVVPSPEFDRLCRHPRLQGWFRWLLGAETHLHKRKIIRHTRPGDTGVGTATQAHYDLVYLRDGTDRVLSAWIPLGDCPVHLGGLTYLEGSHARVMAEEAAGTLRRPAASITADLPALAEEHDTRWLTTDYRAGDVVIHSAHIIHAALDNTDPTGAIRLSTDIRYQRRDDPIDWRWQEHWHPDDGL